MLDGPIGVGKTSLGRAAAPGLGFDFVDGDDHSAPGPWLRSILRTSRATLAACETSLQSRRGVLVSYPLRCTNWVYFNRSFARLGIDCHCIGLTADLDAIQARDRRLSADEVARSAEMITQGYGRRAFSTAILRTDEGSFDDTQRRLMHLIRQILIAR